MSASEHAEDDRRTRGMLETQRMEVIYDENAASSSSVTGFVGGQWGSVPGAQLPIAELFAAYNFIVRV